MVYLFFILFLSFIGIVETAYLIRQRKIKERPICILGKECHKVLESKYSKLIGVNNDILGLLFYIAIFILSIMLAVSFGQRAFLILLTKIFAIAGFLFSLILIFIQWRIIKSWCFWCVLSAATTMLMAITIIYFWQ